MGREIWSKGKFRVHTISRLVGIYESPFNLATKDVPIEEGLGIESMCDDEGHYVVIAFVRPNKDGVCSYDSVGDRIEEYCPTWGDTLLFREAFRLASEAIGSALEGIA